jgi:competence protein ComEC
VPGPLLPSLIAFALGVGWLQTRAQVPSHAAVPLLIAAALVCVGWRCRVATSRSAARSRALVGFIALVLASMLGGFGYAAWRAESRLADALPAEWEGQDIEVTGIVDGLPRASDDGVRFALAVERVRTRAAIVPSRISLAWHIGRPDRERADARPQVRAGERWSLVVRLRRPHGTVNPGGFDLEAWLLERNLRATGYVRTDEANRLLDAFAGRPSDYVERARETIRERAFTVLDAAPHAAVLVALAIGDQSGLTEAQWAVFNRTGTGHLISVSGLHVTVFALLAGGAAFALARRSVALTRRIAARKVAAGFGLVASLLYVLLAGAEVPAQRTLAMLAVSTVGVWLGRPGTGLAVWLWALTAVLAWDPWAMLSPGFWLSFFAVGLLIYGSAGRCRDERSSTRGARVGRTLIEAARAQSAITIGLVPLSLALFQQVSLIGPIANAIAIPVVTFAVVPTVLSAAAMQVDVLWLVAHAVLAPLMQLLEALAALPGAVWAQHEPPRWTIVVGIAGVAWCLAPRGVPGRWLGALAIAPLALVRPDTPPHGTFRLTVLDVGQGTAIVVQTHAHTLLYDTGPRWHETADAGSRIVAPFARARGIRAIDAMVISHRDLDHAGGASSVIDRVPVRRLLSSLAHDHPIVARHEGVAPHLRCRAGQHWQWDGVAFDVLFPEETHYAEPLRKPNDLSCVLRVKAPAGSVLLAGDIEARSEADLLAMRAHAIASDVLVVPHHGSRTSSTRAFVDAVSPSYAVFTVGYRNRFGHPRADIVARYESRGIAVRRTDLSGALTFEFDGERVLPPRAERSCRPRYWYSQPEP